MLRVRGSANEEELLDLVTDEELAISNSKRQGVSDPVLLKRDAVVRCNALPVRTYGRNSQPRFKGALDIGNQHRSQRLTILDSTISQGASEETCPGETTKT